MSSRLLCDSLRRIWNAQSAGHSFVELKDSKFVRSVLDFLSKKGFIGGFSQYKVKNNSFIRVDLKFFAKGGKYIGVLSKLKVLYKPSSETYVTSKELTNSRNPMFSLFDSPTGFLVLSTNQGIMSASEAQKRGIGGLLLFFVD